jgi:Protein of unknown function (DUF3631)
MTAQDLLAKNGIKLESCAPGRHYTTCPKCSRTRGKAHQNNKVLGVTIEADGSVRWGCNHCGWSGPEKGSGERQELPTYIYRDRDGVPRFRKVRNLPGREPRFWIDYPDGRDGWESAKARQKKKQKAVDTKILYRLNEVTKAIAEGRLVAVVEGEKDADNLAALGIISTCNAHGASEPGKQPKWTKTHSEQLRDADIVVLNDNDPPGFKHADTTCELSLGLAKRVRRLDLAKHWPDMPAKADVSDWLADGHTGDELRALIEGAPDYEVSKKFETDQRGEPSSEKSEDIPTNGTADDDAELERLAKLPALDYERSRKEAGKRLGISRLSLLDALVKAKRAELGLDGADDGMQGRAIAFPTPEQWPDPVDGAVLLDEIATAIRSHVVLDEHARDATALWAVHTYIIKLFSISPKLFIRSAARGCGKSTLLDVLAHVVVRPMLAANITTATAFRIIEKFRPTLLIDEVDSFLKENEELRGVLNASHRYDGVVPRLVGEDHEPRNFSVYTAIALAGIGGLQATLFDRSVIIDLQRRKASEPVASLRIGKTAHLDVLVSKILRWVTDNDERIAAAEPAMPPGVINRLADNWHALLAIADAAGGKWPERARAALLRQQGFSKEAEAQSLLELLLADIYEIFTAKGVEQISSTLLAELLAGREDRPWGEYGRNEKPITPAKVAYLLRPLHITAKPIRIEQLQDDGRMATVQVRGYRQEHFAEVFDRFSSSEGGAEPLQCHKCDEMGTCRDSKVSQDNLDVTLRKSKKSSNGGLCDTVTVRQGGAPPLCTYCGRPGGNRVALGDGIEVHLHPGCERPYIDQRLAEEGIS